MRDVREDPELRAAIKEVEITFDAWNKARAKYNRSRRADSRAAAADAEKQAERAYRAAADKRDKLVELDRARRMQTGDPLAVHHNTSKDGPAIEPRVVPAKTRTLDLIQVTNDTLRRQGRSPLTPEEVSFIRASVDPVEAAAKITAIASVGYGDPINRYPAALTNALNVLEQVACTEGLDAPPGSTAFEISSKQLQEAAIRFVAELARAHPAVLDFRADAIACLKPVKRNRAAAREFQGPGTSGHPRNCGCAACRNFDD